MKDSLMNFSKWLKAIYRIALLMKDSLMNFSKWLKAIYRIAQWQRLGLRNTYQPNCALKGQQKKNQKNSFIP
jgi:hypothetical protein